MHITRELLLNTARDFTARTIKANRSIIAVYLIGSLLTEEPLLGGTTDIDLVFIHDVEPPYPREIQRLTDEITLDIYHYAQAFFDQPRQLRLDPILGSAINSTRMILHDTQHWFEYTQAIITAQFDRPDYQAERVRSLINSARAEWWRLEGKTKPTPKDLHVFLNSVEKGTNALASISGLPLTERRFMLSLAERCQAVNSPQLALALSTLLGFTAFDFSSLEEWVSRWENALSASDNPLNVSPAVHPYRKLYYLNAAKSFFEEGQLESCLWIILSTWTTLSANLSNRFTAAKDFPALLSELGYTTQTFNKQILSLDQYLDAIEEVVKGWSQATGS